MGVSGPSLLIIIESTDTLVTAYYIMGMLFQCPGVLLEVFLCSTQVDLHMLQCWNTN